MLGALWRLLMPGCNCTGQEGIILWVTCLLLREQRLAGIPWCKEGKGQAEHLGSAHPPLPLPKAQPCLVGRLPVLRPGLAKPQRGKLASGNLLQAIHRPRVRSTQSQYSGSTQAAIG